MSIGFPELLVILAIVVLVFGTGRLPKVMSDFSKGIKAFKDGLKDDDKPPPDPAAR